MLKINVLIKDLPNSQSPKIQSPKILCHSLQKKIGKHSDDIGVVHVLLFRPL